MTAAAERTEATREPSRASAKPTMPQPGGLDDLLHAPLRTVDVELHGKSHRLRELTQGHIEGIASSVLGNDESSALTGYKARAVACALVYRDGRPYFEKPLEEWSKLNDAIGSRDMDVLFDKLCTVSPLTKASREEMGKDTGSETTNAGGPNSETSGIASPLS